MATTSWVHFNVDWTLHTKEGLTVFIKNLVSNLICTPCLLDETGGRYKFTSKTEHRGKITHYAECGTCQRKLVFIADY